MMEGAARKVLAMMLAVGIAGGSVSAAALEVRVEQVRAASSRVAATLELRDLLRDGFLEIVQRGRSIFLHVEAELWEDRRIADRLTLTTSPLTYRIGADAAGIVIVSQSGDRSTHAGLSAPLPLRVDVGPASVLVDNRTYYVRAAATAATVAERDIEQVGTAIFGDPQSAAGLAGLGRFVFGTLLRLGRYLESTSAEATSGRYTGLQIKSGP